jgi:hypothetical protein
VNQEVLRRAVIDTRRVDPDGLYLSLFDQKFSDGLR